MKSDQFNFLPPGLNEEYVKAAMIMAIHMLMNIKKDNRDEMTDEFIDNMAAITGSLLAAINNTPEEIEGPIMDRFGKIATDTAHGFLKLMKERKQQAAEESTAPTLLRSKRG